MITLAKPTRALALYGPLNVHGKITSRTSAYLTMVVDKVTGSDTGTDHTPTSGLVGRPFTFSLTDVITYTLQG